MAHTKRYKKSKSTRKRTLRTNASSNKKHKDLYARNKKRNSIIRNIRMGRSTFNRLGGGYIRKDGYNVQEGGGSQFIGSPWTVSNNPNTGNYFAQSPLGVGTGNVPRFDDGQSINNGARWPTQNGPQLAKLGEMKGGRRNKKQTIRHLINGGGIIDDIRGVYSNIVSSATDFNSRLDGVKPPLSSSPWDQPISTYNNI
uniref:Uncharacterized protein n=1 Tax=viral metagenome TaxID=1070528 RepID=A0A6C0EZZ4_9ZZZZ